MAQALRKPIPETRSYRERIRELVEQDRVGAARTLLAEALKRGNHGEDLSHWQSVLAPAKAVALAGGELDVDRTADFEWLKTQSEPYRGQWVALYQGELVAHNPTLQGILKDLESHPSEPGRRALLHRIH